MYLTYLEKYAAAQRQKMAFSKADVARGLVGSAIGGVGGGVSGATAPGGFTPAGGALGGAALGGLAGFGMGRAGGLSQALTDIGRRIDGVGQRVDPRMLRAAPELLTDGIAPGAADAADAADDFVRDVGGSDTMADAIRDFKIEMDYRSDPRFRQP